MSTAMNYDTFGLEAPTGNSKKPIRRVVAVLCLVVVGAALATIPTSGRSTDTAMIEVDEAIASRLRDLAQSSGKEDKWMAAVADAPRTIMMDSEQAGGNRGTYSYTISWGVMQSYGYKNMLFDKQFVFGRDPPDWDQSSLISGASRNEAAATLSRAALMNDGDINTAQLPYRFNFTLVRPVFVGDVEEFSAMIQYLYTNNSIACGHAIVSGMGTVNGTVHTIATIAYKCMHDQPDRLSEKGYRLREANGPEL